jgi:hypothetical protein
MSARCSGWPASFPTSAARCKFRQPTVCLKSDGFTRTYRGRAPAPTTRPIARFSTSPSCLVLSYSKFKGTLTLDASSTPTSWSPKLENLAFIGNADGFGAL